MTITVVECKDKAMLAAFQAGLLFSAELSNEAKADGSPNEAGYVPTVTTSAYDDELAGHLHCLIIEDGLGGDNATYRLDSDGLHFEATGVEI